MTDPMLDEQIALVKACMESFRRFHQIFNNAALTETVVPEDEGKLQDLRQTLPQQWDSLFRALGLRSDDSVRSIVALASSLSTVIVLTDFEKRKLYDLWHRAYMKLNFLLGRLGHRRERLQALSRGKLKTKKLVSSPVFVLIAMVIALIVYILVRFGLAGK